MEQVVLFATKVENAGWGVENRRVIATSRVIAGIETKTFNH
jgi:hypothetical protein